MAEEWDVFQMLPGSSTPVYLATLYEAREKTIRPELHGPGSASFAINRTSPECTELILAEGNLVKVRIPEIDPGYIFAFFLETGDFTLISSQETGGEMLTFGGRGNLSYLSYACAWYESYITGGQSPIAGIWRAYAAGTGAAPGQILRRMIEEMQDPDRPQQPLPLLTIDFDYTNDSDAAAWTTTDATDEFSYQVGEDGLAILTRLLETDAITVQMSPDFLLSAYNTFGRDLTGAAFGAGVVRFERGVNIATELRRERIPTEAKTHMLVAGESDHYARAVIGGAAGRVTKEAYLAAFGTGTTALVGMGLADLQERERVHETITFPIANRRTDVSLAAPVTVGSVKATPGLATAGCYLPGPEGTLGDFWVGDTVRVHTGSGQFDFNEVDARVLAITISRDDDNGELIVIPELEEQPFQCPDLTPDGYYPPLGGPGATAVTSNPTPDGYIAYWKVGGTVPFVPTVGFAGEWNFPTWEWADPSAFNPAGWVDLAFGDLSNMVRMFMVGSGTLTVHTLGTPGVTYDATLNYTHPVLGTTVVLAGYPENPCNTPLEIAIPDLPGVCTFWVDLSGNSTGAMGGAVGFDGMTVAH